MDLTVFISGSNTVSNFVEGCLSNKRNRHRKSPRLFHHYNQKIFGRHNER